MKLPHKLPVEQRVNRQSITTMVMKAVNNAAVGFPISALLNVIFTLPISKWFLLAGMSDLYYPFILGVPFVIVSVVRQFLIDYYMAVYNINCDPSYLIKKYINILVKKLKS